MSDGQHVPRFDPDTLQWLTVLEAARVLGVSERQARRYAARLSPADRQEEPDTAPDMTAKRPDIQADMAGQEAGHMTAPRPAKRPARVRLEAMRAVSKRETALKEPDTMAGHDHQRAGHEAGHAPDMTAKEPDTMTEEAGHMTAKVSGQPPKAPADWTQREADFREEVRFLRSLVEQRDRDAAELRAALREALKAQPRQLEAPAEGAGLLFTKAPLNGIEEPEPTINNTEPKNMSNQAQKSAAQQKELRPLWKLILGIR